MPGRKSSPARLAVQVEQIKADFAAENITVQNHPVGVPDGYVNFLFRAARVLARTADAGIVQARLNERFGETNAFTLDVLGIPGLAVFTLTGDGADDLDIDEVISELNQENGRVVASFDHILHVTGACCPASEPEPVGGPRDPRNPQPPPPPLPAVNPDSQAGHGVRVAVIDSGILTKVINDKVPPGNAPAHPWLTSPTVVIGEDEPQKVGIYTGHGTFVAGVLRCVAPAAEVKIYSIVGSRGAVSETDLVPQVIAALDDFKPHIVSMSAGTRTTGDNILLSFEVLREKLDAAKVVLVCAAGNDGDFGPFVPASLDWREAVAVGALEADGTMAPYSNHGPAGHDWVDAYARGSDIVNAYPNGKYRYTQPPRGNGPSGPPDEATFSNGMANWSGTSFSTPIVAGVIAGRLSRHLGQESPVEAAQAVTAFARGRNPNGLPVLEATDAP